MKALDSIWEISVKNLKGVELERKGANASTTIALATVDTDYQNLVKIKTGSVSVV